MQVNDRRILGHSAKCGFKFIVQLALLTGGIFPVARAKAAEPVQPSPAFGGFANGPSSSPDYFPIGVWLQSPHNAPGYKEIGINLYVGLWEGPTEGQLTALEKEKMPVICAQNEFARRNLNRKIIVGWMHADEPDNAQTVAGGGYGPPVTPEALQAKYKQMHAVDPSRPVYLNLGQGVAWDGWVGRGTRTNKPEDYAQYLKAADIASFDIYPAVSTDRDVTGKLWLVPFGVERLRQWSDNKKVIWNYIETAHVTNANVKPTPAQVKSEVWMSIIHGSRGIIYFAHDLAPKFQEAGLLADTEMAAAVGKINAQITKLAPVINSPTVDIGVTAVSSRRDVPVDVMVKRDKSSVYIFSVAMRDRPAFATFNIPSHESSEVVTVLDEDRTITAHYGRWVDDFADYSVHIYRIANPK